MQSFLQSLTKVGKGLPFNIPKGFQTSPNSIKDMIRIMNLPNPEINALHYQKVHSFEIENPQGLTFAFSDKWFLSSEKKIIEFSIKAPDSDNPYVRRIKSVSLSDVTNQLGFENNCLLANLQKWFGFRGEFYCFDHIGDITYGNGLLFAPIRDSGARKAHILVALTPILEVIGYARLCPETSDAWCAYNPWNDYLYTPNADDDTNITPYDVSEFYNIAKHKDRWGREVNIRLLRDKKFCFYDEDGKPEEVRGIQGATFSYNGRIYVARYRHIKKLFGIINYWDNYIHIYNSLTGVRLGKRYFNFAGHYDEIEGLDVHYSGVIYVAVAENDVWETDEFDMYAFKYADSSLPV